jgi:hypothetical protein
VENWNCGRRLRKLPVSIRNVRLQLWVHKWATVEQEEKKKKKRRHRSRSQSSERSESRSESREHRRRKRKERREREDRERNSQVHDELGNTEKDRKETEEEYDARLEREERERIAAHKKEELQRAKERYHEAPVGDGGIRFKGTPEVRSALIDGSKHGKL